MSGIQAVDRVTLKRREYSESSPAKIRSNISSILNRTASFGQETPELIKNISDVLQANRENIAKAITEDTGKGISASRKEITSALNILADNTEVNLDEPPNHNKDQDCIHRIQFRNGTGLIYPDRWCPVLSFIERLVPSLHTRKLSIVSPDSRSFSAVKMLLDEVDPMLAFRGGLVESLFASLTKTMILLERERISDILFSGSNEDLSRLRHHCNYSSFRAETGEGFSVMVAEDSKLDECATSIADIFLDFSRPPFRRPATVIVEASAEEYLKNRLIEEISKHSTGDPFSDNVSVGVVQHPESASKLSALLLSGKNKTHDILHWDGYQDNIFHPALVKVPSETNKLKGFNELPLLKMHSMASIQEGFDIVLRSGNLMFSSFWSSDPYMEDLASRALLASCIYFDAVPWKLPIEWNNSIINENVVQGPTALIKSMMSQKSILHGK